MRRSRTATVVKKHISVIPPNPENSRSARTQYKRLKVAAYCRVSTQQEQQETSYEAQVSYYTEKINSNPEWILAGMRAARARFSSICMVAAVPIMGSWKTRPM